MSAFTGDPGITDIAAAVAAVISVATAWRMHNINEDYYDLYKTQREFYFNEFGNLAETPFANEVFSEPLYSEDMPGAYASLYNDMLAFLDPYEGWYERKMRMYHMPNFIDATTHSPQALDRAAHQDDWGNYHAAREKHLKDVYDNRRISRQLDSLNVGVKQGTAVERGLASSFAVLDDAWGTAGDFFATQANGLSRMSGYFDARRQIELSGINSKYERGSGVTTTTGDFSGQLLNPFVGMNMQEAMA